MRPQAAVNRDHQPELPIARELLEQRDELVMRQVTFARAVADCGTWDDSFQAGFRQGAPEDHDLFMDRRLGGALGAGLAQRRLEPVLQRAREPFTAASRRGTIATESAAPSWTIR